MRISPYENDAVTVTRNAPPPMELLKRLGRPFEDIQKDSEYVAGHWSELLKLYPDEFIAVVDRVVVGHKREHSELLKELRRRGVAVSVSTAFLATNPPNWIL